MDASQQQCRFIDQIIRTSPLKPYNTRMDIFQTIRSLRAVRHFSDQPIPDGVLDRILQSARWTGSAKNTQPWHFIIVRDRQRLEKLAGCGHYASHLKGAALAVVIVAGEGWFGSFDSGRCAQNMMLAAWAEGVGSCIATLHEEGCAESVLGIPAGYSANTAISFGYPQEDAPQEIEGQPREQILASIGRRPLEEMLHWETWDSQ
jgi:nitroreductase